MEHKNVSGEEFNSIQASKKSTKKVTISTNHILFAGIVIAASVIAFWGGMLYQKHHGTQESVSTTAMTGQSRGMYGRFGNRRMGTIGQVTSISSSSITITNVRTGSSSTYAINSSTVITSSGQTSTTANIQAGDTVIIETGSSNSSTATSILVNPGFGGSAPNMPTSNSASGSQTTTN